MGSGVHTLRLCEGRQGGGVIDEIGIDALGDQVVVDGGETLRAFRVMRTHVMQLAVAMGDEGSGRHLFSLSVPAHKGCARRNAIIVPLWTVLQALESV